MDFKSLALFEHLATSLHFGKTAQARHVSPSTLSRVIQRLEDECETSLFVRDNRKVALTPAGKRMLEFTQRVLAEYQSLKLEMDDHGKAIQGELSLFCSVTASQSHLPPLLDQFRLHHPFVELTLITGDPAESVSHVVEKTVDTAIAIHTPDFPEDMSFYSLDTLPLVMIMPKSVVYQSVSDIDWRKHPVVLPESGPSKRIVHHWFAEQGIRPKVYAQVGGNEAIVSMVALGCGLGIVPKVVLEHSTLLQKVNYLPVPTMEAFEIGLCCLSKREKEPVISALIAQIKARN
ncbi:HTH-type transcriptional activator IlvY [Aestuariibacter sp. AA17]|uniref:HTH-type transcriptional activator IlvY n=1 Tax=Fluctibacter corallii TaxID=2984329 RepID=A0ABT3AAZ8_9ALTE|nr:HTH-type transcriptional activator IlvY [Aestuariibacter sp. AA17]MCV2885855.1 HTH-type transcriptional activator IlvY [Aestuariibacter sp. AA17]